MFAIEATEEGVSSGLWPPGWCGVLKGGMPHARDMTVEGHTQPGAYYAPLVQKQQRDWVLPAVMGPRGRTGGSAVTAASDETTNLSRVLCGHPNVLSVVHSFLGSSQLLMPWMSWAQSMPGIMRRRTTWTVSERFPTTLRGAVASALEVGCFPSSRQLALVLLQVLQGLEHGRSRGVVHRDVSAQNVFLSADGRAVVGDWGEGTLLYEGGLRLVVDRTLRGLVSIQEQDATGADTGP